VLERRSAPSHLQGLCVSGVNAPDAWGDGLWYNPATICFATTTGRGGIARKN
jgi:hypothetical protein